MRALCLSLLLSLLAACSTYEVMPAKDNDPAWRPAKPMPKAAAAEDGSLYRNDYLFALFQDRRAYRVGVV